MILEDFLIAIGVKADTKALQQAEKELISVESQAKSIDSALATTSNNLNDFSNNIEDQAKKTSSTLAKTSNDLNEFANNVEAQAKTADTAMTGTTGKLTKFMGGLATFATVAFSAIQSTVMGAWAYFDSTIDKIEELQNAEDESLKTTKEQVEMAKKYRENMDKMGKTIENTKTRIAIGFLPAMYELSKTYADFLDANKELIANGISKVLEWVTKASQVITNFIKFIDLIVEKTIGWKGALVIVAAVFAWFNRSMLLAFATNPITYVVLAIVALLLVIDDFMTYLDGGESQFGEFWGEMLKWIDKVKPQILLVWEYIKKGFGYLVEFGTFVATYFGGALRDAVNVAIKAIQLLYGIFTGNTELIKESWSSMCDSILSLFNNVAMLFEPIAKIITSVITGAFDAVMKWLSGWYSGLKAWAGTLASIFLSIVDSVADAITAPFKKAFNWISDKWASLKGVFSGGVDANVKINDRNATGTTTNYKTNSVVNNNITANSNYNLHGVNNPQAFSQTVNANTQRNLGGLALA